MRQIYLFSGIDEYSSEYIIRQLFALDRESNEEITLIINSPGGYVNEMFAIIDAMNAISSPIRTVVMGMAASAAAVIASAGDTRLITENAQYMLHEAISANWGSVTTMKERMDQTDKMNERMFGILSKNTKQPVSVLKEVTNKTDKYFTAQEAVNFGLADKIIGQEEAKALKLSEPIQVEGQEISVEHKEVQILKTGNFVHPAYGKITITEANLETMKKNFDNKVRGIDISIDYTHDNDNGERPAAFWVKSLEVRSTKDGKAKGLYAKGEFTPGGLKKISEKEYKYSSADFVIDYANEQGQHFPYVLRGGTLTNRPFIKGMDAIKLSEYELNQKEIKDMNKDQLMAALKEQGIDVASLQSETTAYKAKVAELEAKIRELSALPATKDTEIKALKDQLEELNAKIKRDAKEEAFKALIVEGKVLPVQKEEVLKTFDSAEAIQSFYKNAPVVVKLSPSGSGGSGTDDILTEEEEKAIASGLVTRDEVLKNRQFKPGTKMLQVTK